MSNDTVSDLLTRIRNAQLAGHRTVTVRNSRACVGLLQVLKNEGFVESFEVKTNEKTKFKEIQIFLKYFSSGLPVITTARRVSTPGRRVYSGVADLKKVYCGLGVAILSTPQGIVSDREARKRKIGGEILAFVS